MRVALVGTRGVPARYGGFETCVEEVGRRLVQLGYEVTVYCRRHATDTQEPGAEPAEYLGMQLVQLPFVQHRALETLSHTTLSVLHRSLVNADVALVFNAANAPMLPVIRGRRIPVATHVDGLEWQRTKWGPMGRRYYRMAESLAVRWSDALIADAQGIADYYRDEFDAPTEQIAYGAPILDLRGPHRLAELDLEPYQYHLVVARFEPENHVREIVQGYSASNATRPLVVVGSAPYSDAYTARVHSVADGRVRLLGGVWDQDLLNQLYGYALSYLHGQSVGGTNPSLLRAAGAGAFTIAFDVSFNRDVLDGHGDLFTKPTDVGRAIEAAEADPLGSRVRGAELQEAIRRYDWDEVAGRYARLCDRLQARDFGSSRPSGRRRVRTRQLV